MSVGKTPEPPATIAASLKPDGKKNSVIILPVTDDESHIERIPFNTTLSKNIQPARKNIFRNPFIKHDSHIAIETNKALSRMKYMNT